MAPLIESGVADAKYLHAGGTIHLEHLDESARERRRINLIREAAEAGHARAQFTLGQMYEPDAEMAADPATSAYWFEKSALQGYPYAEWVHGLNLLSGSGVTRDKALGLDFIRRAAEGRFEGAIQFVAGAYATGTHGFPKDEQQAELWRRRLDEPGVIRY